MLFTGSYTALLTPFKNGEVDYDSYRKLVDFQIDNGSHGLVPVGTTGAVSYTHLTLPTNREV